ncbi:MAG: hypothetical protein BroJett040_13550 [Oligoflexia bacterium]|nr:MAG: hypothetical protein BroJett040_13550 [Oligoflexia bacterium]
MCLKLRMPQLVKKSLTFVTLIALGFILLSLQALAAPHPGTSTSMLIAPHKAAFFARKGFQLNSGKTEWSITGDENSSLSEFHLQFTPPKGTALLELNTETLAQEMSLESYAKKWVRDYPMYGFEVLGTKSFAQNHSKGFIVDLLHRKMKKQVRQVIFLSGKTSVTLTCADQMDTFKDSLQDCNSIIKTFDWIKSPTK